MTLKADLQTTHVPAHIGLGGEACGGDNSDYWENPNGMGKDLTWGGRTRKQAALGSSAISPISYTDTDKTDGPQLPVFLTAVKRRIRAGGWM